MPTAGQEEAGWVSEPPLKIGTPQAIFDSAHVQLFSDKEKSPATLTREKTQACCNPALAGHLFFDHLGLLTALTW